MLPTGKELHRDKISKVKTLFDDRVQDLTHWTQDCSLLRNQCCNKFSRAKRALPRSSFGTVAVRALSGLTQCSRTSIGYLFAFSVRKQQKQLYWREMRLTAVAFRMLAIARVQLFACWQRVACRQTQQQVFGSVTKSHRPQHCFPCMGALSMQARCCCTPATQHSYARTFILRVRKPRAAMAAASAAHSCGGPAQARSPFTSTPLKTTPEPPGVSAFKPE